METESLDDEAPPRRGAAAVLPNLITTGNGVCGFVALTYVLGVDFDGERVIHGDYFAKAAWFILLGMLFDVFDGRVARMTGSTSGLGAQLDSFCDLVTFGLAPACLMMTLYKAALLSHGTHIPHERLVWVFGLAYFLGAMLRLARFNVEHDAAGEAHMCFRGMPTPAAAGTVASLVLVQSLLTDWRSWELRSLAESAPAWARAVADWIPFLLPFVVFLLGFVMVSAAFRYPHVASHLFTRRSSDHLVYVIFAGILLLLSPELVLSLCFLAYLLWTPCVTIARRIQSWFDSRRLRTS